MNIRPYLTFQGNCQEALELYKKAFKTDVNEIMTFGQMPQDPANPMPIPDHMKNCVLQATIQMGDNYIRCSDTFGEINAQPSELVSIAVEGSVELTKHAFTVLSEGGKVSAPLQEAFFSPCYGSVIDKFGVKWELAAQSE